MWVNSAILSNITWVSLHVKSTCVFGMGWVLLIKLSVYCILYLQIATYASGLKGKSRPRKIMGTKPKSEKSQKK